MIEQIFEALESHETAVRVNIASGEKQFHRAVAEIPGYKNLMEEMERSPSTEPIVQRVEHLSSLSFDEEYENPFDVAYAIYLLVIVHADPELALQTASQLVLQQKNCWWAHRIAQQIIKEHGHPVEESIG